MKEVIRCNAATVVDVLYFCIIYMLISS